MKQINVIPGTSINHIFVDCSNTVEADLTFSYNGEPIPNGSVIIEKLDQSYFGNMHGAIGHTDNNGHIKVYITPGPYLVTISQNGDGDMLNGDSTLMYLKKDNITIDRKGNYDFTWNSSDVGKLSLNVKGPFGSLKKEAIDLSNSPWIFTEIGGEMIISAGSYRVGGIHLEDNIGEEWIGYDFTKHQDNTDEIIIEPGKTFNYNVDLTAKSVELIPDSKIVQKNSLGEFGIRYLTNSGYVLNSLSNYNTMYVEIIKPNGDIVDFWQNFTHGGYFVDRNDPEGIYVVNAYIDFGPVLGGYYLTEEFQVVSDASVYVDSTFPQNGATGVPLNAQIKVNFHCDVQKGDTYDGIKLTEGIGTNSSKVDADISISKNTLTIKPKNSFNYDTEYMVVIPAFALKNQIGGSLKEMYTFTFTTQKPVNIISGPNLPGEFIMDKLSVVDSSPDNNSIGVPINQVITVSFSKRINLIVNIVGKTKTQSVSLKRENGESVPIEYTAIDNKLIIKPRYNLNFGTEYILFIPRTAVCDEKENRMETDYSLSFTTESMELEVTAPAVFGDEQQAIPASIVSLDEVSITVLQDSRYMLPDTVTANLSDGTRRNISVVWEPITIDTGKAGEYTLLGSVEGYDKKVNLILNVTPNKIRNEKDINL